MNLIRVNNCASFNENKILIVTVHIVVRNLMSDSVREHFGVDNQDSDLWKVYVRVAFISDANVASEAIYWVHTISSSNRKMIGEMADNMCMLEETDEFKNFQEKVLFEMLPRVRENRREVLQDVLAFYMENENDEVCKKVSNMIQQRCDEIMKEYSTKKLSSK